MQNMQAIINRHNKTLLAKNGNINTTSSKTCKCRVKADCPLQGNWLGGINRVPSDAREQRWPKDLLRELFHHFQSTVLQSQPIV